MTACFRTELRERRALVKARFTIEEARLMCAGRAAHPNARGPVHRCPACGSKAIKTREALRGRVFKPVEFMCRNCAVSGDAVTFVMAAQGHSQTVRALDAIEDWMVAGADKKEETL